MAEKPVKNLPASIHLQQGMGAMIQTESIYGKKRGAPIKSEYSLSLSHEQQLSYPEHHLTREKPCSATYALESPAANLHQLCTVSYDAQAHAFFGNTAHPLAMLLPPYIEAEDEEPDPKNK